MSTNGDHPFAPSAVWHGKYNSTLTTDATIVYEPSSLLTPWPILMLNLGLSIFVLSNGLASSYLRRRKKKKTSNTNTSGSSHQTTTDTPDNVSCFSSAETVRSKATIETSLSTTETLKPDSVATTTTITDEPLRAPVEALEIITPTTTERHPARASLAMILSSVNFLISTIRSWTSFIGTCIALHNSHAQYHSPTALLVLLLSIFPDFADDILTDHSQPILLLNVFVVFLAMQINTWCIAASGRFYGKMTLSQGPESCAFLVDACPRNFTYVGCGMLDVISMFPQIQEEPSTNPDWNSKATTPEFVFGLCSLAVGLIILFAACRTNSKKTRSEEEMRQHDDNLIALRWLCLGFLLVAACINVPINSAQQKHASWMWMVDGRGPLVASRNATDSWSDCFRVRPPVDKLGFLEVWWGMVKGRPVDWLNLT